MMEPRSSSPILVTGVPRSGTTWCARWLADGVGMALPGREPMNPRGGSYALGGSLEGWARLTSLTKAQRRRVRLAYRGWNPMVYSRYGHRQALAALPGRRVVIKDPFALLSLPALTVATGAHPVLLYRHPGAVLASYRRMGWTADLGEIAVIAAQARADGLELGALPDVAEDSPEGMGHFWSLLHEIALADTDRAGARLTIVSHPELAASGEAGGRRLAGHLQVGWTPQMAAELARESDGVDAVATGHSLHRLDRSPGAVAEAWRQQVDPADIEAIEAVTARTRGRLEARRLRLRD